jgi:hypothetical protein
MLRFFVAASLLLLASNSLKATHAYGGEITWKCFTTGPNAGKFKFYMILYRDCGSGNATLPGGSVALNSNSPAGTITLTQVGTNTEVSPTSYVTPSPIRCNVSASGEGALEEARYEYDDIPEILDENQKAEELFWAYQSTREDVLGNS